MLKFKKIFFPLLIVLTTVLICFLNYTPDTFLTGWDTLHPEFNFSLNFQRLLSLWHQEQGLGAIPAHAQISDLPRVFILYLFHFILPLSFLRYSYIFLMFILGPLGIYFLIKHLFHQKPHASIIAFLTSFFYIFNLSTVQQFYVPFEMFPTQWAFLPWIILFSLKFLKNHSKKNLFLFSIFTLFATPQAYAPQLWYAFFAIYFAFLFLHTFFHRQFKTPTILIVLTLLINAFWLIPNLFYIFNHASTPLENRDNRLYSQEYLLKNRQDGYPADTAIVKGFYLDWSVFDFSRNVFTDLMPQWKNHLNQPGVLIIGYSFFIFCLIGVIASIFTKNKLFISFLPFLIIPFILLTNNIPPFSYLFDFLIKNATLKESFRFIFTKLSVLLIFGITIFFSYFLYFIFQKIKNIKIISLIALFFVSLQIYYCFPMFQGYLISPSVRNKIPDQYFQLWDFMSSQDDGRILTLPLNESSGWQYYNWGYQGSGFLWFNLKQNLLDRDSDRWSTQNEESYKEFFYNLYNQNPNKFATLFQKYNIKYIIWDKDIISPSDENSDQVTLKYDTADLLTQLEKDQKIKLVRQFGSLLIYKTVNESSETIIKNINKFVSPSYNWNYFDAATSDYVTTKNYSEYYPFRDILDNLQKLNSKTLSINQVSSNKWQIKFPKNNGLEFSLPKLNQTETDIPVSVFQKQNKLLFEFPLPIDSSLGIKKEFILDKNTDKITINSQTFNLKNNPSDKILLGQVNISTQNQNYINDQPFDFNFSTIETNITSNLDFELIGNNFDISKKFSDLDKTSNYSIKLDNLPQSFGYIVGFNSQYTSGIPLRFCFQNTYSLVCTVEDQLSKNQKTGWDYFIIPPNGFDFGYNLNISNISYGNTVSESFLKNIVIIPIPFNLLSQTKFVDQNLISPQKYLFLNQAYDSGWLAFYFDKGIPIFLNHHVLANNWANAWEIPTNYDLQSTIYTLFWPQIFEYLGLIITVTTLILVFKKSKNK